MTRIEKLESITLQEFEALQKDERFYYELIDGIVMMAPSPSREHQQVASKLHLKLGYLLRDSECEALYELDVEHRGNIYRPDLLVFCNSEAELPELVVEVLSPSSRYRDLRVKVSKYEEMGVKENWIVDPKVKTVMVYDFVNHTAESYGIGDTVQSLARSEILVAVADIFI